MRRLESGRHESGTADDLAPRQWEEVPDSGDARDARDALDANDERAVRSNRGNRAARPGRSGLGELPQIVPGRITALRERRPGSARFVLDVDGAPVAVVSAELVAQRGLRVGAWIDAVAAEGIARAAAQLAVFDRAVALLAARARSARDLERRLRHAGAPVEWIAAAIERLRTLGILDDVAYARSVALSRVSSGGVSRRRIVQELQRRGVDRRVADSAIADVLEEEPLDEEGSARAAASKRLRVLRQLDGETARRRLYAYLARRGYDGDVVARVVRELLP